MKSRSEYDANNELQRMAAKRAEWQREAWKLHSHGSEKFLGSTPRGLKQDVVEVHVSKSSSDAIVFAALVLAACVVLLLAAVG